VTQTDNSFRDNAPPSLTVRLAWIFLILATLYFCYFHNLGALGFVGPDEPRYAWIARDMAESGDWVTPRLYGHPWFEKPPLFYWGAALSFKLFGVNEAAARLPSAFSALLATLAMAWLAWRLYGAETARWLLLLLPTTVGMIGFSHAAATDMPFSAMLTIAMVFAASIVGLTRNENSPILPRTPWLALIFFGFFLGLAVLAKGPAAIILSDGAVLLWAVLTKRWRDAFRCLHPVAIASFCLTALPWYVLCSRRNPDFFRVFIIEHNFKRFLTPEFQHLQPFWFYVPIILVALFPWTLFLAPVKIDALRDWPNRRASPAPFLFFVSWALFPVVFFSISQSKLPGYVLPALPPLVILLADVVGRYARADERAPRWPLLATAAVLLLAGLTIVRESATIPALLCVSPTCGITRIWALAIGGGAVIGMLAAVRRCSWSLLAVVLTALILVLEINRLLPNMDPGISARDSVRVAKSVWPDFSPRQAATWQLNRAFAYQLNFCLRSDLPEWKPGDSNANWIFAPKNRVPALMENGIECVRFAIYPAVVPCRLPNSAEGLGHFSGFRGNNDLGDHRKR
jgi:4-amino-4-deoxy-L-arabinose transferase-like glycosyltransferase